MPFDSVLVANRGEIASRIIRTLKEQGIESIAVYSEADADAPFVEQADRAIPIGGPRAQESYLNSERIIQTASEAGAEAIHPGYGFLSEQAEFAEACRNSDLVFVGPSAEVIAFTALKSAARNRMARAGVPILPGSSGLLETVDDAVAAAGEIGYPVILKATAGGGGLGLAVAREEREIRKAFENLKKRARAWFKNEGLYIEKYVEGARHVEVQVVADKHGNVHHLFERECSIQRRHQKVIEEAPSPAPLAADKRAAIWEAAVTGAREVGYDSIGTFEFLVGPDGSFYFMEMNARLQVEHPVTEEVTGLDLVQLQLESAAGKPLDLSGAPTAPEGAAIELRLYAEDPEKGFRPSPGTIEHFFAPEVEGVRHDIGVKPGFKVTPYYDPMIAKITAHGRDRSEALARLRTALKSYEVKGIKTNIPLLRSILEDDRFRAGTYDTSYLKKFLASA